MADLLDRETFAAQYDCLVEEKEIIARALGIHEEMDFEGIRKQYEAYAERLRPMVFDTARLINAAMAEGKAVMFEGAQATMLDIDHGTYPFVTSSSAAVGGLCTGAGVAPTRIHGVIGVSGVRCARGGPFPTEIPTGGACIRGFRRIRLSPTPAALRLVRCVKLRHTAMINGFDSMVIRLDVPDPGWIPVWFDTSRGLASCRPRRARSRRSSGLSDVSGLDAYGGYLAVRDCRRCEYVEFLEARTGVEAGCISTGPERNQTIVRPGSRLEKLIL
jgi:adenylosuccinate synthase